MAADYEATPITADEILSAGINRGFLPSGLEDRDPKRS